MVFVDREKELELLEKYYESCKRGGVTGVLIYGWRRVGKTTLVREFLRRHSDVSVYVNCLLVNSVEGLLRMLAQSLCEKFGRARAIDEALSLLAEGDDPLRLFYSALTLPRRVGEERGVTPIVAFDEFHVLIERLARRVARELKIRGDEARERLVWLVKAAVDEKGALLLFLSSLGWAKLRDILKVRGREPPLAGVLATLEVKPLSRESAKELALHLNPSLSEDDAELIAEISGGVPKLIEIIAARSSRGRVLESALEALAEGAFDDFFENILDFLSSVVKRDVTTVAQILSALSAGHTTVDKIADATRIEKVTVYTTLEELVKVGIVEKSRSGRRVYYALSYPLLAQWMELRVKETKSPTEVLASTLGVTAESYIRELLSRAVGKEVRLAETEDERYFLGTTSSLVLRLKRVLSVDETREVLRGARDADIIAEERDRVLVIEVKATLHELRVEDVDQVSRAAEVVSARLGKPAIGLIVQLGTGRAPLRVVAEAARRGVIIVTRDAVRELAKMLHFIHY